MNRGGRGKRRKEVGRRRKEKVRRGQKGKVRRRGMRSKEGKKEINVSRTVHPCRNRDKPNGTHPGEIQRGPVPLILRGVHL